MKASQMIKVIEMGYIHWNKWRLDNGEIKLVFENERIRGQIFYDRKDEAPLNLEGVTFINSDLSFARFYNANLSKATFRDCNLDGLKIYESDLSDTKFSHCSMDESVIYKCDASRSSWFRSTMQRAEFEKSNFAEADFGFSTIHSTYLFETDFSRAVMGDTVISATRLHSVVGLETIIHNSNSSIGLDTLILSGGEIPETFLRLAGVPENFVEYLPSLLVENPIPYYNCMISYSRKDLEFVELLTRTLREKNVDFWIDRRNMKGGDSIRSSIDQAVRTYQKFIVIISGNSIESEWVEDEVELAFEQERVESKRKVIPIFIDNCITADSCLSHPWLGKINRRVNMIDFTNWQEDNFFKLRIQDLLKALGIREQLTK